MLSRFFLIVVGIIFTSCVYHDLAPAVPKCDTTGNSWETDIRPIMVTYCALDGCHNGITKPDFRIYENAKDYASEIKSKTQDGSMPFDDTLTQDQIDAIACWVDNGALEN